MHEIGRSSAGFSQKLGKSNKKTIYRFTKSMGKNENIVNKKSNLFPTFQ